MLYAHFGIVPTEGTLLPNNTQNDNDLGSLYRALFDNVDRTLEEAATSLEERIRELYTAETKEAKTLVRFMSNHDSWQIWGTTLGSQSKGRTDGIHIFVEIEGYTLNANWENWENHHFIMLTETLREIVPQHMPGYVLDVPVIINPENRTTIS